MPFQVVHDGVVREFALFAPVGWQTWWRQQWESNGRGLPLVVALHGGGQDPAVFATQWPFPPIWLDDDPENKFFLLYPFGFALADDAGGPVRSWNTGMTSESDRDDVGFIQAAIAAADDFLRKQVVSEGLFSYVPASAFDQDRKYLFGYSAGGMMAYRLVSEMENGSWAAMWVMESSFGGTPHAGFTQQFPVVEHAPPIGPFAISLFAHHGGADDLVPAGGFTQRSGTNPSLFAERALSGKMKPDEGDNNDPVRAGRLQDADANDLAPAFRTLAGAFHAFKEANFLTGQEAFRNGPDIHGGFTSVLQSSPPTPLLQLNQVNPVVARYLDPLLEHTGYWEEAGNLHYFTAPVVWSFFKAHPRTFV
jgi:poly(3-hydroxybutyrate) depolymerase